MSAPIDHSRGHTPAKKGDHENWRVQLYHNQCGRRINKTWNGYTCEGPCRVGWHPNIMAQFDDDAMATRFHVRTEPDTATYTIVWRTDPDSKRRYSTCIPLSEVRKDDERFRL